MASEKASSSNQGISSEKISDTNVTNKSNVGKELAKRAILRSYLRKNGRRKFASNNNVKLLPSRLSKASLGDQDSSE
ncbi:unnamed protein product [Trifolium pratense]|uniref:Uncharacterized protein n=1 Tax=Trifolium pratense TaxID=57577 RepID=A0ACB0L1B5_TRIPR|nr:unnamed protein product [Trifolium pratense]